MKKLIYLLILTFGVISCTSDDETGFDNSQLVGKWNWISSCGGVTGNCVYPSEDNYETLEFSENLYIKRSNGVLDIETSYLISDTHLNGTNITYVMELGNGTTIRFKFITGNLSIEGGDFWMEYERIE